MEQFSLSLKHLDSWLFTFWFGDHFKITMYCENICTHAHIQTHTHRKYMVIYICNPNIARLKHGEFYTNILKYFFCFSKSADVPVYSALRVYPKVTGSRSREIAEHTAACTASSLLRKCLWAEQGLSIGSSTRKVTSKWPSAGGLAALKHTPLFLGQGGRCVQQNGSFPKCSLRI